MKFLLKKYREKVDVLGGLLSFVCAIHCLAVPILLTFGVGLGAGALGSFFSSSAFDLFVLCLSIPLALISLVHAYTHGTSKTMVALFVAAIMCFSVGLGHTHEFDHEVQVASLTEVELSHPAHESASNTHKAFFFALGGALIAALHFTSRKSAKQVCCEH